MNQAAWLSMHIITTCNLILTIKSDEIELIIYRVDGLSFLPEILINNFLLKSYPLCRSAIENSDEIFKRRDFSATEQRSVDIDTNFMDTGVPVHVTNMDT